MPEDGARSEDATYMFLCATGAALLLVSSNNNTKNMVKQPLEPKTESRFFRSVFVGGFPN